MNIAVIPDAPTKKVSRLLPIQKKAGFTNSMMDLSVFTSKWKLGQCENMSSLIETYLRQCQDLQLEHTIGRAAGVYFGNTEEQEAKSVYQLTTESIQLCTEAGCRYIIVEPLIKAPKSREECKKNEEFYFSFAELAAESNVMLLIPNNYSNYNGNFVRSFFSDADKLNALVEILNEKSQKKIYGICLDIGVCNICGQNMYEVITQLGDKVKAVILRENDGLSDNAVIPFSSISQSASRLDWLNLIRGLRTIDFDGELIFDFRDSMRAVSHLLHQEIVNYAHQVIDFLVWQIGMERTIKRYDKRVLFGAGNMCRNYMKCYGEIYPPLFTCDNNTVLWGTEFESLMIKNPEELLHLSPDTAIFICNIYYDEIEQQLRKMGVRNPIEKFNDEYLPSMYTDRFDADKRELV